MRIRFIRHYKLESPFDITLPAELKQSLAKGEASPDIHPDFELFLSQNFTKLDFAEFQLLLASPILRAQSTAKRLNQHFELDLDLETRAELKESTWDPSLGPGRISRFIASGEIEAMWSGFDLLESSLKERKPTSVLAVTHSFTMQNLWVYFREDKRDWRSVNESDIFDAFTGNYLEGFTVDL